MKTGGGPDRLTGGLHGWASSCVGAPRVDGRVVYLCLFAKVELQMPAHSVQNVTRRLPLLGIPASSPRCWWSADLADSRALRQAAPYQAQRIFGPSQEWRILSNS